MPTYDYREVLNEVLNQVQHLTPDDQLRLVEDLVANIRRQGTGSPKNIISWNFEGWAKRCGKALTWKNTLMKSGTRGRGESCSVSLVGNPGSLI